MDYAISFTDVILIPSLLTIMGLLIHGLRLNKGRIDIEKQKGAWLGYLFLLGAIGFGAYDLWCVLNPETGYLYVASIVTKRTLAAHYLMLPVLLFLVLIMWLLERRLNRWIAEQAE